MLDSIPAPGKHFYHGDGIGITYNTPGEAAAWLFAHTAHIDGFTQSMFNLAAVFGHWGDFKGMRETLNLLVDVLAELATLKGEDILK